MTQPEPDASTPEASVIVVTHNNEALIARCLKAISGAAREHASEVIVVDNASTDGTLAAIASQRGAPKVIPLKRNVGFAAANNAGIEASRGRLIVLVNSDAFPDEASIDRLIEAIDMLPAAGIVGGRLRYPDGRLQPSAGRSPSLLGGLWVALMLHRAPLLGRAGIGVHAHPALYRRARRVDWVTAAFCIARREVGPLPSKAFMYGEDVWWGATCAQMGLAVWFEPAASAVHVGRASVERSHPVGFAQRRRAQFELEWFAQRGSGARLAARGVLALHALVRLTVYGASAALRRPHGPRVSEQAALLRAALSRCPERQ